MASYNIVHLLGSVIKEPIISKDDKDNYIYAMVYLNTVRADRYVGDGKSYTKCDHPLVLTGNPDICREMESWKENDIVLVKGSLNTRQAKKTSCCPNCETKNRFDGELVFVEPIFAACNDHMESANKALDYLVAHAEVSNQVFMMGRLAKDPHKMTPKEGLVVTQYQLAIDKRFRGRGDISNTGERFFPWIKSYGDNAMADRKYLHTNSEIIIDGFLQARSVNRKAVCEECGTKYDWQDKAMEVVPYMTQYVGNIYTEEEIARAEKERVESIKKKLLSGLDDGLDDDEMDESSYDESDMEDAM